MSNEFGAGNIDRAKSAMAVTLKLSVLLALIVVSTLAFGHNIWARFFSDNREIIKEFAPLTPFLAISITFDFMQGVLSGLYTPNSCILHMYVLYFRWINYMLLINVMLAPLVVNISIEASKFLVQGWQEAVVGSTWPCMLNWQHSISLACQLHYFLDSS